MSVVRVVAQNSMVNIDSAGVSYSSIEGHPLHQECDSQGLQLHESMEHKRGEIIDLCSDIASKIYELQKTIER